MGSAVPLGKRHAGAKLRIGELGGALLWRGLVLARALPRGENLAVFPSELPFPSVPIGALVLDSRGTDRRSVPPHPAGAAPLFPAG